MDNIIIYNTGEGNTRVQLYVNDGRVWMTRAKIAALFRSKISAIIYDDPIRNMCWIRMSL